jgi:hypothetical protein
LKLWFYGFCIFSVFFSPSEYLVKVFVRSSHLSWADQMEQYPGPPWWGYQESVRIPNEKVNSRSQSQEGLLASSVLPRTFILFFGTGVWI